MHARIRIFLTVVALLFASETFADGREPLREARSDNGRFRLRIQPGYGRGEQDACARATLLERVGKRNRERRVWQGRLANKVAPQIARIRDDGRFIVTLDEFRRGGAAHAVVIYDRHGRQLREFALPELLCGDDWKHVQIERRAIQWLAEATFTFVEQPPQFVIRLKWGREIRIDLEKLAVAGRSDSQAAAAERRGGIPEEIAALLEVHSATASPNGTEQPVNIALETALAALGEIAAVLGLDPELPKATLAMDLQGAEMKQDASKNPALAREAGAPAVDGEQSAAAVDEGGPLEDGVESQPAFAGNSEVAGWPIPLPDPRDPVDYHALVIEQTVTDGPSAGPFYDAAAEAHVAFEGDYAVYEAALCGDPEALNSPEITAWLEANQAALANFRAATQFEYRGRLTPSEDEVVFGVTLPALAPTRALSRLAIIEAKRREASGDMEGATDSYAANFLVGKQMAAGPTLIENLVGIAIQEQTARHLLDSLASESGEPYEYAQLAGRLERDYQPLRPVVEVFQGERMCCLDLVQRLYEWNPDTQGYQASASGLEQYEQIFEQLVDEDGDSSTNADLQGALERIGFEGMVAEVNQHYDALSSNAVMPYQEARHAWKELDARVGSPEYQQHNPLLAEMLPALSRVNHLATRAKATRNATRLVANLKAYRQEYGAYPDSLGVFGESEMTVDPFTGARFSYRRDGDDFTLYSLSENGVDDGGVHDRRGFTNDVRYWPRPARDE